MRASSRPRPRGFILPTTMLVVVLLTVMLTAAFMMISAEYRTTDNAFASSRSLAIAQAGLENYFSVNHALTGTSDTARYTFSGGYARVAAFLLRQRDTISTPRTVALWMVRSIGYDTVRAPSGQPNGQRAIAQFAEFQPARLPVMATIIAPNGVFFTGSGTGPIGGKEPSGFDACGAPHIYALTGGMSGAITPALTGSPTGIDPRYTTWAQINDALQINWPALLGAQFTPDYTTSPPCLHSMQESAGYPFGFCNGNASLSSLSGKRNGLLIVTGNVTLESNVHWDGILVVGGIVSSQGADIKMHGIMITGLNGPSVAPDTIRRGSKNDYWPNSCYTDPSLAALSGLVPIKNAWVDTWSTY